MPTMINSNETTLKYITVKFMKTMGKKNLKSCKGKIDFMGRRRVRTDVLCKTEQTRGPYRKVHTC